MCVRARLESYGFGLFTLLPKEQEARLCLCCTEGLVEMLRQETWLHGGPLTLKAEQNISLALIWLCQGKDFQRGMVALHSFTEERVRP